MAFLFLDSLGKMLVISPEVAENSLVDPYRMSTRSPNPSIETCVVSSHFGSSPEDFSNFQSSAPLAAQVTTRSKPTFSTQTAETHRRICLGLIAQKNVQLPQLPTFLGDPPTFRWLLLFI